MEVSHVPDIVVRHIEDSLIERIKSLAREKDWSINDVLLHALRTGLGMESEKLNVAYEFRYIADLAGTWKAEETAAFEEALKALATAPEGQLAQKKSDT
jgi:NRPS condensation-like uncharacterized protein